MAAILSQNINFARFGEVASAAGIDDIAALALVAAGTAGYLLRGTIWDKRSPYHHVWYEKPQLRDGGANSATKETRNIAEKLAETDRDLVIFWGSQSGTAEGFANRLARECHLRFGIGAMAADLSDYDAETIALIPNTKFALFIISTYGEGDPSDNTAQFWDWLHANKNTTLANLRYAAFGLGNSNYKFYNRVIDIVVEALDAFGARPLLPVAKADDASGATEEDFMAWKEALFAHFTRELHYTEREITYTPSLAVIEDTSLEPIDLHHGVPEHNRSASNRKAAAATSPIYALPVKTSRELFSPSASRNCLHVDLDLSAHPELKYRTGDHLAFWPSNPDVEVSLLLSLLGLDTNAETPLLIKALDPTTKLKIPSTTTPTALLRHYIEICAPLSRSLVASLAQFAPTPASKDLLTRLGKDKDAFHALQAEKYLTLARLMRFATPEAQQWTQLPLAFVLESLPALQPRYYSISSSAVVSPRTVSITAVVTSQAVTTSTSTAKGEEEAERIPGVATNYLLALSSSLSPTQFSPNPLTPTYHLAGPQNALEANRVYAHIRRSKFKLPFLSSHPLIMVAAGTGIAPFLAFLQERQRLQQIGKDVGQMLLFFGCRNPTEDFIYREELSTLEAAFAGKLKIVTAFSRVKGEGKVYVQDRVREFKGEVAELLNEENHANFYICGAAKMGREVGRAVGDVLQEANNWDEAALRSWSEREKRLNRWQEDVWG